MGKPRAIYGTGVKDNAICAYVQDKVEDYLYNVDDVESELQGFDFTATMIRRMRAASEEDIECTTVDYTDFNYQHTLQAQRLLFKCLADQLESADHHPHPSRFDESALQVPTG